MVLNKTKDYPFLESYKIGSIQINLQENISKTNSRIKCGVCGKPLSKKGRKICLSCVTKRIQARYKL